MPWINSLEIGQSANKSIYINFSKQENAYLNRIKHTALLCLNAYWFHGKFISCTTESRANTKVKSRCYGNDTRSSLEAVVLTLLHRARMAQHVASKHMDPVMSHSVNVCKRYSKRLPRSISDALNALALQTSWQIDTESALWCIQCRDGVRMWQTIFFCKLQLIHLWCKLALTKCPPRTAQRPPFKNIAYSAPQCSLNAPWGGGGGGVPPPLRNTNLQHKWV